MCHYTNEEHDMATKLIANDWVACEQWCSDTEQASVNRHYYRVATTDATSITDLDVATHFAGLATEYTNLLAGTANYNGCIARIINRVPLPVRQVAPNLTGGTAGAVGLPRQTSGIISVYTALAKQANRGRLYLPFPATASDQTNGIPTNAYVAALNSLATVIFAVTNITGALGGNATLVPVLLHPQITKLNPAPPPKRIVTRAAAVTDVSVWFSRQVWATQRRRGSYGRANKSPV
jgi:hypothetical protein